MQIQSTHCQRKEDNQIRIEQILVFACVSHIEKVNPMVRETLMVAECDRAEVECRLPEMDAR